MKVVNLYLALSASILAIAGVGRAAETGASVSTRDLQAKIEYCQTCHGLSGQGYKAFLPMPRIAGQTTQYIDSQLLAFIKSLRDKNISIDMAKVHDLSTAMRFALAAHFTSLDPEPIGDGPRDLVATGKTIYAEGVPETNVAACSGCHGPEAKGKDKIPRLAGQLYSYTEKELTDWSKVRGQNPSNEGVAAAMTPVAHSLSAPQISALAAYLSYLKK